MAAVVWLIQMAAWAMGIPHTTPSSSYALFLQPVSLLFGGGTLREATTGANCYVGPAAAILRRGPRRKLGRQVPACQGDPPSTDGVVQSGQRPAPGCRRGGGTVSGRALSPFSALFQIRQELANPESQGPPSSASASASFPPPSSLPPSGARFGGYLSTDAPHRQMCVVRGRRKLPVDRCTSYLST